MGSTRHKGQFRLRTEWRPPPPQNDVEGALLGLSYTFRDLGVDVYSGFHGEDYFEFVLYPRAEKRWEFICKILLGDLRGYDLHICKRLYLKKGGLAPKWYVRITARNLMKAADDFRKSMYSAWSVLRSK